MPSVFVFLVPNIYLDVKWINAINICRERRDNLKVENLSLFSGIICTKLCTYYIKKIVIKRLKKNTIILCLLV